VEILPKECCCRRKLRHFILMVSSFFSSFLSLVLFSFSFFFLLQKCKFNKIHSGGFYGYKNLKKENKNRIEIYPGHQKLHINFILLLFFFVPKNVIQFFNL